MILELLLSCIIIMTTSSTYDWHKDALTIEILKNPNLNPKLVQKAEAVLDQLQKEGWQPQVAQGFRTKQEQEILVKEGNSHTMNSYHCRGLAVDIVDIRYQWNIADNSQFWQDLGKAYHSQGMEWGGDWQSKFNGRKDVAHGQLDV